jgi:hypothetical protein
MKVINDILRVNLLFVTEFLRKERCILSLVYKKLSPGFEYLYLIFDFDREIITYMYNFFYYSIITD